MSQRKKINKDSNLFMGAYKMPHGLCDNIIDWFENYPRKSDCSEGHQGYICQVGHVFHNNPELESEFLNFLRGCLGRYTKKYKTSTWTAKWHFKGNMNVQKYPPGKYYNVPHSEVNYIFPSVKRHLVFMTYLNTIKEGGGTKFFNQKLIVKPKKGLTIIWPAHWTHTHIGMPAPKETKYVITGWYEYEDDYEFFKSAEDFLAQDYNKCDVRISVTKK